MAETMYRNRRAARIENSHLRVTMLEEGGHIAEIFDKQAGVNPLWTPPWPSIEPSAYSPSLHPEYGASAESKLLAGIMGHNLCMDIFGGPTDEEAAAGMTVHGEASVTPYEIAVDGGTMVARAALPEAGLRLERRLRMADGGRIVRLSETVENMTSFDRPIGWTQHVTIGPPFLEKGATELRAPATRSRVMEADFAGDFGLTKPGADFDWPHAPAKIGGTIDLRIYTKAPASGGYTAQLMDPRLEQACFLAWSPRYRLVFGYAWRRIDFPWLGIWEENYSRGNPPWNGKALTWGLEFGVSPMPETRRAMLERGTLFGVPAYRWIPAKSKVTVEYCSFVAGAERVPASAHWDGADGIILNFDL